MNKESSIKQLKRIKQDMIHADDVNALDFAIRFMESKALEQKPKRGHWIRKNNTKEPLYGWYFCSECNSVIGDKTKFCSNCGAKMESEE